MTGIARNFLSLSGLLLLALASPSIAQDDLYQPSAKQSTQQPSPKPAKQVPTQSTSDGPGFVGTWVLSVDCPIDFKNTLVILVANRSTVLGTGTTLTGTGQIVGGRYVHPRVDFTTSYERNGKQYGETWTGKIDANDRFVGSLTGSDVLTASCTFVGVRQ